MCLPVSEWLGCTVIRGWLVMLLCRLGRLPLSDALCNSTALAVYSDLALALAVGSFHRL